MRGATTQQARERELVILASLYSRPCVEINRFSLAYLAEVEAIREADEHREFRRRSRADAQLALARIELERVTGETQKLAGQRETIEALREAAAGVVHDAVARAREYGERMGWRE